LQTVKIVPDISFSFQDYPDPKEHSIIVYFIGCEFNCENCHNVALQNPSADLGKEISLPDLFIEIEEASKKYKSNKIVFSGGDPFYSQNAELVKNSDVFVKTPAFDSHLKSNPDDIKVLSYDKLKNYNKTYGIHHRI
jgi:pyruvate-formate lyase-activating enzyme